MPELPCNRRSQTIHLLLRQNLKIGEVHCIDTSFHRKNALPLPIDDYMYERPGSNMTLNILKSLQNSFPPANGVRARFIIGIKNQKKAKSSFTLVDYSERLFCANVPDYKEKIVKLLFLFEITL
jgi:hypothetical protein